MKLVKQMEVAQPDWTNAIFLLDDDKIDCTNISGLPEQKNLRIAVLIDWDKTLAHKIERILQWRACFPFIPVIARIRKPASAELQTALYLGVEGFLFSGETAEEEIMNQLSKLKSCEQEIKEESIKTRLDERRKQIDLIDRNLIKDLAERSRLVREMAGLKHQGQLSILQPERWQQVMDECLSMAAEKGISVQLMKTILQVIHLDAIEQQEKVYTKKG